MAMKHFPADTSLEYDTFLNDPKVDGELYNYLLSCSYGEDGQTVIYKNNLPSQEKIATILKVSRKTINTHLKYLKDKGYLVEDRINKKYILPKVEKMYFKIPQETSQFLRDTVKDPVVKTYVYLGQRNSYKPGQYVFTIKEICEHLGLNYKNQCSTIRNYLLILEKCGLIKYAEFFDGQSPRMRLLNVITECPKKNE